MIFSLRKNAFFIPFICLLLHAQLFAGAWTQKKNGLYLKISSNYLYTTQEFNHVGDKLEIFQERFAFINTSFRDFNINAYVEYGIDNRFTVIANLPYKILTAKRSEVVGDSVVSRILTLYTLGVSDLSLSARYALFKTPFALAIQGGFKIPLGYDKNPVNEGAPLGTGELDFEGNLLFGKSLYPLPLYLTGGIGYRQRSGALHDQILYTAEAGFQQSIFLFKVTLDGLFSTTTPPDLAGQAIITPLPGGGGAFPNIIVGDQDIHKISPSLIVKVSPITSFQLEALHIFSGKNTVAGTVFSFGVVIIK